MVNVSLFAIGFSSIWFLIIHSVILCANEQTKALKALSVPTPKKTPLKRLKIVSVPTIIKPNAHTRIGANRYEKLTR